MRTPVLRLMAATVKDILACLDAAYPFSWALPEDRVGLQVGDPGAAVATILVALEVSPAVVAEARDRGAQFLLTHHPLLYQPVTDIREDRPVGTLLAEVIRAGMAAAACHTNLDLAPEGLNDHLARGLGLLDLEVLAPLRRDAWRKLTVFVPTGYEDRVRAALCDGRVGVIGRYSHCTFAARGQGTYLPLEGARPFKGEVAALSRAEESRLEVVVPESELAPALARLKAAHPYEEVAYDLYPLVDAGPVLGFGRVGRLPQPLPWEEMVNRVKKFFAVSGVRVWGRPPTTVSRAAVCGGSGGDLIGQARQLGASVYITGECRHHQAVPGPQKEFAIIEVGHFASEVVFMPVWAEHVAQLLQTEGLEVQVRTSVSEAPPFQII
ncbi:MAG: Nif3-like dinuclear metal center hexameric protein [Thermodesulfobacteriota bacterium]